MPKNYKEAYANLLLATSIRTANLAEEINRNDKFIADEAEEHQKPGLRKKGQSLEREYQAIRWIIKQCEDDLEEIFGKRDFQDLEEAEFFQGESNSRLSMIDNIKPHKLGQM